MSTASSTAGGSSSDQRQWLLGEIAVFNKLLTQQQVDECLAIQADLAGHGFAMKLGKVLIEKYYVDRMTLSALLRSQATQRGEAPEQVDVTVDLIKFTPDEHELLVHRVRERKLIEAAALDAAIDIQFALDEHGIDKQLGEICIEKGILSRDIVGDVLARHEKTRRTLALQRMTPEQAAAEESTDAPPAAEKPPTKDSGVFEAVHNRLETKAVDKARIFRFGRLAKEKDLLTSEQVEECLYLQFRMKELGIIKKLGEVCLERGYLTQPDIRRLLQLQRQRVSRIAWNDLTHMGPVPEVDQPLVLHLKRSGILGDDEIGECRYVQGFMAELGIARSLADVLVDKEFLDPVIVDGIGKELARQKELAERPAIDEGPTQVGHFTLKSSALEDAYKNILDQLDLDDREPEPSRRETLQTLAKKKSPQRRAAIQHEERLSQKPFWVAAGVLSIPFVLAGMVILFQSLSEQSADRRRLEEARAEREEKIAEQEAIREEDATAASEDRARRTRAIVVRMIGSLGREVDAAAARELERAAESLADIDPSSPLVNDADMLVGRAYFYRVMSQEFRLVDRELRRRWVETSLERLGRAADGYDRPGGSTLIDGRAIDPETGQETDLALHLPETSPEHRLYRVKTEPCFDPQTGTIDYRGQAEVAAREVRRLVEQLRSIQEGLE